MPFSKDNKSQNELQSEKFKALAREVGAEENEEAFERTVRLMRAPTPADPEKPAG